MGLLFVLVLSICTAGICAEADEEKRCFAPVVCSDAHNSGNEWYQVFPPRTACENNETVIKSVARNIVQALCPLWYREKCFVPRIEREMSRNEAERFCRGIGGELANVYDKYHIILLAEYLRWTKRMSSYVTLHTGMRFTYTYQFEYEIYGQSFHRGMIIFRNGTENRELNEFAGGYGSGYGSGSGSGEGDWTEVTLQISSDPIGTNTLDYGDQYDDGKHEVLCEI